MTYEEYKAYLEKSGSLNDVSRGLLSAFEMGYSQGLKENPYPYSVMFYVEQAIKNGVCHWEIENAFEEFERERQSNL